MTDHFVRVLGSSTTGNAHTYLLVVAFLLLFSCTAPQQTAQSGEFSFDQILLEESYLVFDNWQEADQAVDYFFQADIETEYREARYDNRLVFIIPVTDPSILDYEYFDETTGRWYRIFPEYYKELVTDFYLTAE